MKISYGITVHNEAEELNKLLEILVHKTQVEDEIIIVDDFSDEKTQEVISSWSQQYLDSKVDLISSWSLPPINKSTESFSLDDIGLERFHSQLIQIKKENK